MNRGGRGYLHTHSLWSSVCIYLCSIHAEVDMLPFVENPGNKFPKDTVDKKVSRERKRRNWRGGNNKEFTWRIISLNVYILTYNVDCQVKGQSVSQWIWTLAKETTTWLAVYLWCARMVTGERVPNNSPLEACYLSASLWHSDTNWTHTHRHRLPVAVLGKHTHTQAIKTYLISL